MGEVDFTEENRLRDLVPRSQPDSNSALFRMFFKSGVVRSADQAFYLCVGISCFFFFVSAIVVVTAL